MKKLLFLLLYLLFFNVSGQKIQAIGIDLGENIVPLLMSHKGFTGGILVKITNKNEKIIEYKVGYGYFKRANYKLTNSDFLNNSFTQNAKGFYASIGKITGKKVGWHATISTYNLGTTLFLKDRDFDKSYEYSFPNKPLFAVGGDIFYEIPIKITKSVHQNIRFICGICLSTNQKNTPPALYIPGFSPLSAFFTLGVSAPLFIDLKKK